MRSAEEDVALHLRYVDALEGHPYILGDEFSMADIQLSVVGEMARTRVMPYSNMSFWMMRMKSRPAYRGGVA